MKKVSFILLAIMFVIMCGYVWEDIGAHCIRMCCGCMLLPTVIIPVTSN